MSVYGIVIIYIGWGCQSPNPQEIHCFKWEFCVRFVWFWFARLFQESIPGTKWNLPVLQYPCVVRTIYKYRLKLYRTEIKINCIQTSETDIFTSRVLKSKSCIPSSCVPCEWTLCALYKYIWILTPRVSFEYQCSLKMAIRNTKNMYEQSPIHVDKWSLLCNLSVIKLIYIFINKPIL